MKERIYNQIKKQLKDISQSTISTVQGTAQYKQRLSGNYDLWRLARYICFEILLFKVADQPFEKINWYISFSYQNKYNCSITHEKFGFRLYVSASSEEEAKQLAEKLEAIFQKALLTLMPLIEHYAKQALSNGEIIVENNFIQLYGTYNYFQSTTNRKKKIAAKSRPKTVKKGDVTIISSHKSIFEVPKYEIATCFSFFSLLEHICVLFLAYINVPENGNVGSFASLKWSEKFKTVFDLNESEFKSIYDKLIRLAKNRRNPAAHGGTQTVFSFYLEGAKHKISCSLNDKVITFKQNSQQEDFDAMQAFLKLVKTHPSTRSIFLLIESGLNVSFSKDSLATNNMIAGMSKNEVEEYIDMTIRQYDDMANMDW